MFLFFILAILSISFLFMRFFVSILQNYILGIIVNKSGVHEVRFHIETLIFLQICYFHNPANPLY